MKKCSNWGHYPGSLLDLCCACAAEHSEVACHVIQRGMESRGGALREALAGYPRWLSICCCGHSGLAAPQNPRPLPEMFPEAAGHRSQLPGCRSQETACCNSRFFLCSDDPQQGSEPPASSLGSTWRWQAPGGMLLVHTETCLTVGFHQHPAPDNTERWYLSIPATNFPLAAWSKAMQQHLPECVGWDFCLCCLLFSCLCFFFFFIPSAVARSARGGCVPHPASHAVRPGFPGPCCITRKCWSGSAVWVPFCPDGCHTVRG